MLASSLIFKCLEAPSAWMLNSFKAPLDTCTSCPGKTPLRDRWRRTGKYVWKNPECHLITLPTLAEPSGGQEDHTVSGRSTPKYTAPHTPLLFQTACHMRERNNLCLICIQTAVLEKTLNIPGWTARRSNQSILKNINPEYSLQGLMLRL